MYVPEKLKVNKFKEVRIPSKGEYWNTGRFIADTGTYGGENEPVSETRENIIDKMHEVMREYDAYMQEHANE